MRECKTLADIVRLARRDLDGLSREPIRLSSPGFMDLVIDRVGPAPTPGLVLLSVGHYFTQNGDRMSDPEMTFEVNPSDDPAIGWASGEWRPQSFTQHSTGCYREAVSVGGDGRVTVDLRQLRDQKHFARIWNRNLRAQGFLDSARAAGSPAAT